MFSLPEVKIMGDYIRPFAEGKTVKRIRLYFNKKSLRYYNELKELFGKKVSKVESYCQYNIIRFENHHKELSLCVSSGKYKNHNGTLVGYENYDALPKFMKEMLYIALIFEDGSCIGLRNQKHDNSFIYDIPKNLKYTKYVDALVDHNKWRELWWSKRAMPKIMLDSLMTISDDTSYIMFSGINRVYFPIFQELSGISLDTTFETIFKDEDLTETFFATWFNILFTSYIMGGLQLHRGWTNPFIVKAQPFLDWIRVSPKNLLCTVAIVKNQKYSTPVHRDSSLRYGKNTKIYKEMLESYDMNKTFFFETYKRNLPK